MEVRPRVGVSSCLLGEEVRFNGGHKRYRFLTDELGPLRGLGAVLPRSIHRAGDAAGADPADRGRAAGQPERHRRPHGGYGGAARCPARAGRVRVQGQVAELRHPGHPAVRADGTAARHDGRGLYAGRVLTAFPLLAVEDEGRLNDAGLREAFCERIFATAAAAVAVLRAVVGGRPGGLPRPAQAAAAGARPGALPGGGPGRGRRDKPRRRTGTCSWPRWPAGPLRGRTANALQHAYSRIGGSWTGRGGWTWWPGSRPTGAARSRSACRSRCSRTTRAAGTFPGWPEQTFLRPFPPERLRHPVSAPV